MIKRTHQHDVWNDPGPLCYPAGNVVERMAYDPYGAVKFFTPTWTEKANSNYGWKHLHQGLRRDMAVGLDDSRARDLFRQMPPNISGAFLGALGERSGAIKLSRIRRELP